MAETTPKQPGRVHPTPLTDDFDDNGLQDEKEIVSRPKSTPGTTRYSPYCFSVKRSQEQELLKFRAERTKDDAVLNLLITGIKKNQFCAALPDSSIVAIVNCMEYFYFKEGQMIVKEGNIGQHFFVTETGELDVRVRLDIVNVLRSGDAFGADALLYNCPRTATVVAASDAGVWGADGDAFRRVLREHTLGQLEESRRFLDKMELFEGLSAKEKERLGERIILERLEPGASVIRRGERPSAVFFVKSGRLRFVDDAGTTASDIHAGECFGWRPLLYGGCNKFSVLAATDCEIMCVGVKELRQLLGEDLEVRLRQHINVSVLRKSAAIALFPESWKDQIASRMSWQSYAPGIQIPVADLALAFLVQGNASGSQGGESLPLRQGQWHEDQRLFQIGLDVGESDGGAITSDASLVATAEGCHVSLLHWHDIFEALEEVGFSDADTVDKATACIKKLLLTSKVPSFEGLSQEQLTGLVSSYELKEYRKGHRIIEQGTHGKTFFMILEGEVRMLVDGTESRLLGPCACFGERSLLFKEKSQVTMEINSEEAKLWVIDQETFGLVVSEGMREKLVANYYLKSTQLSLKSLKHVRVIGAGVFGTVRMVEHQLTAFKYAMKRVHKKDGHIPHEVQREREILDQLKAQVGVVHLVQTFETQKSIYFLMELVTGGTLDEQVLGRRQKLTRKQAQFYFGSLVLIVESLHSVFVLHRDLKPANIMLDMQGYLKCVDLGLAKKLDGAAILRTFTICGTPAYMCPEAAQGIGYAFECDLWSLGVILYELVCGEVPFGKHAKHIAEVMESIVSDDVTFPAMYNDQAGKRLIQGLLEKDSSKRLGLGATCWEDIKGQKYFKAGVSGNIFSQIAGRELKAPWWPEDEVYPDMSGQDVSLSDAEELAVNDPLHMGCRMLQVFKGFDVNGDGYIDRNELSGLLKSLDGRSGLSDADIDTAMVAMDLDKNCRVDFEEFVKWIYGDSNGELSEAMRHSSHFAVHSP